MTKIINYIADRIIKWGLNILASFITISLICMVMVYALLFNLWDYIRDRFDLEDTIFTQIIVIICAIFSIIIDSIPMILLLFGYRVYEKNEVYRMALSDDKETRRIAENFLLNSNIAADIFDKVGKKEDKLYKDEMIITDILRDYEEKKSIALTSRTSILNKYKEHLEARQFFPAFAITIVFTILNLTIINANYKWSH